MMTSTTTSNRLATIATRQSKSRVRDVVFALSVALAVMGMFAEGGKLARPRFVHGTGLLF